jgi:hypothetical protein
MSNITVKTGTSGKQIYVYGDMFNHTTDAGLFLSSNKFDNTQKYYDFYSGVKSTSAGNPPFSAYPLYNYKVYSNNILSFELPAFYVPQLLSIIFANDAGYIASSNIKRIKYIEITS